MTECKGYNIIPKHEANQMPSLLRDHNLPFILFSWVSDIINPREILYIRVFWKTLVTACVVEST